MEIKAHLRRLTIKIETYLRPLTEDPRLNLAAGLALLIFSLLEVGPTLLEDIKAFNLGSHHGASIFGAWHIFKVLPDCLEGIERIYK